MSTRAHNGPTTHAFARVSHRVAPVAKERQAAQAWSETEEDAYAMDPATLAQAENTHRHSTRHPARAAMDYDTDISHSGSAPAHGCISLSRLAGATTPSIDSESHRRQPSRGRDVCAWHNTEARDTDLQRSQGERVFVADYDFKPSDSTTAEGKHLLSLKAGDIIQVFGSCVCLPHRA